MAGFLSLPATGRWQKVLKEKKEKKETLDICVVFPGPLNHNVRWGDIDK